MKLLPGGNSDSGGDVPGSWIWQCPYAKLLWQSTLCTSDHLNPPSLLPHGMSEFCHLPKLMLIVVSLYILSPWPTFLLPALPHPLTVATAQDSKKHPHFRIVAATANNNLPQFGNISPPPPVSNNSFPTHSLRLIVHHLFLIARF
jgi:hypothetical protein